MSTTTIRTRSHDGVERTTELDERMFEELKRKAFAFIIDSSRFGQEHANTLAEHMSSILKRKVSIHIGFNIEARPKFDVEDFVRSKATGQIYLVQSSELEMVRLGTIDGRYTLSLNASDLDPVREEELVEKMRNEWSYYIDIESTVPEVMSMCRIEQKRFLSGICEGDKVMLVGHDDPMVVHRLRCGDRVDLWNKGLDTLLIDQPNENLRPC